MDETGRGAAVRWLTAGSVLLALALSAAATALAVAASRGQPDWALAGDVTYVLNGVATALIGAPICLRQPRNPIGWMFLAVGIALGLQSLVDYYLALAAGMPGTSTSALLLGGWLTNWLWAVPYTGIPLVLALFPDGRYLSPRWRWLGYAAALWLATVVVGATFANDIAIGDTGALQVANPLGLWDLPQWLFFALLLPWLLFMLGSGTWSLALRWRRGDYVLRQQVKYLALAMVPVIIVLVLSANEIIRAPWFGALVNLTFLLIPAAVTLAVVRYRLYDVDFVLRRTTSYALLTGLLAVVYFAAVVVLQRLLSPVTGDSTAAVVLSTLLIAALFLPLRRRVQAVIDRRFNRHHYDAEQVLAQFAATARDETDLDRLTAELVRVIQETMEPASVTVWLRPVEMLGRGTALPDDRR